MRVNQTLQRGVALLALSTVILLGGCRWFVSHYDATAYENFTNLKAFHLKFFDDYGVADQGKTFDGAKIRATCDTGELRFREAKTYADGKGDQSRARAVDILHKVFRRDCDLAIRAKRLTEEYVKEQKPQVAKNYDLAVAGESDRVKE